MEEPTALLPPVSTSSLSELLENGPIPLRQGLELLGIVAGQVAKLHDRGRTHGLLTGKQIRVSIFESGPPAVILLDAESTRDMSEGADQFAIGVLAFQVLAGRDPKVNETLSEALPDAPAALDRLVAKLMAPRSSDRLAAAGAQRQLLDLAATLGDPQSRPVSPLGAPPQIKRGVPIGAQKTDAHAWVRPETTNPFGDDEATATGDSPLSQGPPPEDEKTEFAPIRWKRQKPTDRMEPPLPPPVPTPMPTPAGESTRSEFEPSRSDLPGNTGDGLVDPRLAARRPPTARKRDDDEHSPMSDMIRVAKRQPPWVWGAVGVGLAFLVLMLIALAR